MEPAVKDLVQSGIAVDLLVPSVNDENEQVGVRLRTFAKSLPKNKMVLGKGKTFVEALDDAYTKAAARRWEPLEWAARPWPVKSAGDLNLLASWGLS
jgi:hypothetical protein